MYIDNIAMTHFLVFSFHESQPAHEISNYNATKTMVLQVAFFARITILIALTPASAGLIALREQLTDGLASRSASDLFELLQLKSTLSYHWSEGKSDVLPAA